MQQSPEPPLPAAPGKGVFVERRRYVGPGVLGLLAASLALYLGLSSGVRSRSNPADEESPAALQGLAGAPAGSLMPGEIEFQRRRQAEEERRGKAVDELVRQFGSSSVGYLRPGTASDASGRLMYDDVGKGAGKSIRGILRPKEARKKPNAIALEDAQLKSGLKDLEATSVVPGGLTPAGKAIDVAPSPVTAGRVGDAEPLRQPAPTSAAGLLVKGEPERDMRIVAQGGVDAESRPSGDTKAVNPDPGMVSETLERTNVPPTAPTLTNAGAGKAWKGLQRFQPNDAVQKSVQAIERGKPTETQMAKLTSAHVYGRQGGADNVAQEPAAELGGIVFDGKEPPTQRVSGLGEAEVGDAGGSNLHHEAADQLEADLKKCLKDRANTEREQMRELREKGKVVRAKVAEVRDAMFACSLRRKAYEDCKAKDCSGPRKAWRESQEDYNSKMRAVLKGEVAELVGECEKFNAKALEAGKDCQISRGAAMDYECSALERRPREEMEKCFVPGPPGGEECQTGC